jgi:hypothetical protein
MKTKLLSLVVVLVLATLVACGESKEAGVDTLTPDTMGGDAALDTWTDDTSDTTADLGGDAVDTVEYADVAQYGFDLRVPGTQSLECTAGEDLPPEVWDVEDMDYLCTFAYGGVEGHLYLQATPASCVIMWGPMAEYDVQAWLEVDGTVTPLQAPGYDYGGNHHNDSLTFDLDGQHFKYYHSSFGWGWRSCQEPDCIQILDDDGFTVLEDGCTTDRSLPIVCRLVGNDGHIKTLDDTFKKCLGDPNLE